jgi:hypothetical protein
MRILTRPRGEQPGNLNRFSDSGNSYTFYPQLRESSGAYPVSYLMILMGSFSGDIAFRP